MICVCHRDVIHSYCTFFELIYQPLNCSYYFSNVSDHLILFFNSLFIFLNNIHVPCNEYINLQQKCHLITDIFLTLQCTTLW